MGKPYMVSKQRRDRIVRETRESLERDTPDDVLLRKIITETGYSLSGAQKILSEAKLFASEKEATT